MHCRLQHSWLSLTGPDAQRYLQGQVTADITALKPGAWQQVCLCDHKGALHAVLGVRRAPGGEGYWIDFPAELAEVVPARLDRYLIADDAELEVIEPSPALIHVLPGNESESRPDPEGLVEALAGQLVAGPVPANRFGHEGLDLAIAAETLRQTCTILNDLGHAAAGAATLDDLRIETMTPAWGAELVPGILPPEGGLGEPVISLTKGCYLGQEVLSRIRSVGRARQLLARVQLTAAGRLEPGWTLHAEAAPGTRAVGNLGTISADGSRALGRLRGKVADEIGPGGRLFAAPPEAAEKALFTPVTLDHSVEPFAR